MVTLIFDRARIPRTTTREQWRAIWRWKRATEKELAKHEEEMRDRLQLLAAYGTTHPELLSGYIDRMANPPVMIYPKL